LISIIISKLSSSFVGGDPAGHHIYDRATKQGKRVQANLGAKNHATILPDADKAVCE
jgi:malonate-semialdehyde dehydrogenase (acetylating)/methylmalonate-semialdehyde dehydrogenase